MKRPMIRLPGNIDELKRVKQEAEETVRTIVKRESELKREYSVRSEELQARIKNLNAELKQVKSELGRFQRENRSARRKLADERIKLTRGLGTLKQRYAGMISRTRKKVSENPEVAFRLMEALK
jgi:septation ring formation regulator EzrA